MTSTQQKTTRKTQAPVKNGHAADTKPPKAEKVSYKPFLSGAQENIAELIGDLLIAGGSQGDIETLIDVALGHEARRFYSNYGYSPEKLNIVVTRWVNDRRQRMIDDLAVARASRPTLPKEDRPEAKTISDRIRQASRESLKHLLVEFMGRASAEEVRLLENVLKFWDPGPFKLNPYGEIPLADSFCQELGGEETYIRVPNRLAVDMEQYLATLMKLTNYAVSEESED